MTYERKLDARLIASIVAAGIMTFSGVVVETAMNVTFPTLMGEFGVDTATVQWVTTGYLLVLSVVIPTSSYLRRRFRLRQIFCFGGACFLAGTLLAAVAPSFGALLAGRLIEGLGTGVALPLMFNIILEQVPQKNLGLMIGVGNLITAAAPAIGPSVGGLLVSAVSWRAVFWALVPLIVVALATGLLCIRQVSEPVRTRFDAGGLALLAVGFASIIFGANAASESGWASGPVIGLLAVAAVALAVFARHSLRCPDAILNVRVFRSPVFTLSALSILLVQMVTLGFGFLIPNYAQIVLGTDAFTAGCLLVPGCIVGAALAPVAGGIMDRMGAAIPLVAGSAAIVAASLLFSSLLPSLALGAVVAIYAAYNVGMGTSMPTNMANGLAHLPGEQNADGNAVINTAQQLAGAIGTAIASSVVAMSQAASPDLAAATAAGTQEAFAVTLGFALAEAACVAVVFGVFKNRAAGGAAGRA